MSVISEKCASSLFSFCVLVTLLRAQVHGDWGPALQMWSFVNPPRGSRTICGLPPETLWKLPKESIEAAFPHMELTVASVGLDDCPICLQPMAEGEVVRQLPCKHWFHDGCILEWIEKQWNSKFVSGLAFC